MNKTDKANSDTKKGQKLQAKEEKSNNVWKNANRNLKILVCLKEK